MKRDDHREVLVLMAILSHTLNEISGALERRHAPEDDDDAAHLEQLGCALLLQSRALRRVIVAYERTLLASTARKR